MPISLSKGQKISLSKEDPGITHLMVGLGWDTNRYDGGYDFDLDASAFLLGANHHVTNDSDFVFYSNTTHPSRSVIHSGDNRTGAGEGDDEVIKVDLSLVPPNIERIEFTVTIYDSVKRSQTFGMVSNAYIRVVNDDTGKEVCRFDLGEDFSQQTAVVAGAIYRRGAEWRFDAIGSGYDGGLAALCASSGIDVQGE